MATTPSRSSPYSSGPATAADKVVTSLKISLFLIKHNLIFKQVPVACLAASTVGAQLVVSFELLRE